MTLHNTDQHPQLTNITKGLRHIPGSQNYIPGIDGLRALAVVAVMLYHLSPSLLPGGFSGVDIFFVISGYVVSTSLSRDLRKSFGHFILGFYARRIVRIIPALVVCLLIVSFVTNLFVPTSWLSNTNKITALTAFLGLSNFGLIYSSDSYFSPRVDFNPFIHTWSLAIEEQFYLIFPLLFYAWLITKDKSKVRDLLGSSLVIIFLIVSLVYSAKATATNPQSAFYLLPSRFWELACGAGLFQLQSKGFGTFSTKSTTISALMLGTLLIALAFTFSNPNSFPFPWAILSVTGSALMIAGVSSPPASGTFITRLLDNPLMTWVGKLSYSLYLWHWPVYVLFRWTIGLDGAVHKILAVVVTFLLAYLSFIWVETPIRRNQYVRSRPQIIIVLSACVIVGMSLVLARAFFNHQQQISLSVTRDRETWYPEPWPSNTASNDPKICNADNKSISRHGLDINVFYSANCTSVPTIKHKVFILGDSHAGAYATMSNMLTEKLGIEVWVYSKGGCGVMNMISSTVPGSECEKFVSSSLADISKFAKPGDVLFFASLRMNRYGDEWAIFPAEKVKESQDSVKAIQDRNLALEDAEHILTSLDGSGLNIIIDAPKPILRAPPFRCSDWYNRGNPVCQPGLSISRAELLEHRKPIMKSIAKLQNYRPNLIVWDPFSALCPNDRCTAFDKTNKPLFFDGDHLSAHGNRVVYPSFQALLMRIWSKSI